MGGANDNQPLVIRQSEVCALLGWDIRKFRRKLPELKRHGFPPWCPVLEGWHRDDVLKWIQHRFGHGFARAPQDAQDPHDLAASRAKLAGARL
jgi:hypothetical protein